MSEHRLGALFRIICGYWLVNILGLNYKLKEEFVSTVDNAKNKEIYVF